MIPEAAYAMLACARIGAIHSVVFGGFSIESLKDRILDSDCTTVITANEGLRGGKLVPLKNNVDKALEDCPNVHSAIVVNRTKNSLINDNEIDIDYYQVINDFEEDCPCEEIDAEDPLFILYTSGSTGEPKGVKVSYGNLNSYINSLSKIWQFKVGFKMSQTFDLRFDPSLSDIFNHRIYKLTVNLDF